MQSPGALQGASPEKTRVNSLNPGVITTGGSISGGLADSPMRRLYVALTPLGRMGEPDRQQSSGLRLLP